MLTCDICGEVVMLEEDMKTHLLLSHLENDMCCPLCSLSGVSYDELCFHITSAHPEEQRGVQGQRDFTSSSGRSAGTNTGGSEKPKTKTLSCLAAASCDTAAEETPTCVTQKSPRSSNEDNHGVRSEHKPKHPQASPRREKLFSCPMCPLVCSSPFILQEHIEVHLQEQSSAEESLDSDLKLARQLQHEEEQRRRQEEAQQEREEFKKLQRQFGLDGRGGYRRQTERTMEGAVARGVMTPAEFHCKRAEMMEMMASGVDDGKTRTQGVTRALYDHYQAECRDLVHVWLSADTDHFCSSAGDKGWGCGYRNFQMLLSSLHRLDAYSPLLQENTIPSIPQVQSMVEKAWKEGLDPQGASHFNQRLQGTRAWIGATEIYVLLTSLRISARIIDFHTPTGPDDTHPRLFEWVKQYFCQSSSGTRLPPRLIQTSLPPLYLQYQGHSCSIVGIEQKKNGSLCLLLLDPGFSTSDTRKLLSRDTVSTAVRRMRKFPRSLKHKQYQVVAARGVLSAEEKQVRILNSRTLCAERIP
ncbi:zinc finger-containing ubiquitin peptidase 1 [Mugil cephalus]|uniref:zinc finger-containing ubiquitin peptidase 1 n=1 Tax=Mugil cephalus TaxID=48193 RepID=UPI001FB66848|nr:zinc finger-containing ubiquitin peptidase 1 [Mugil cephalus]